MNEVTISQYSRLADDYTRFLVSFGIEKYVNENNFKILRLPKIEARIFGIDLKHPDWKNAYSKVLLGFDSLNNLNNLYSIDDNVPVNSENARNVARYFALKVLLEGGSVKHIILKLRSIVRQETRINNQKWIVKN